MLVRCFPPNQLSSLSTSAVGHVITKHPPEVLQQCIAALLSRARCHGGSPNPAWVALLKLNLLPSNARSTALPLPLPLLLPLSLLLQCPSPTTGCKPPAAALSGEHAYPPAGGMPTSRTAAGAPLFLMHLW